MSQLLNLQDFQLISIDFWWIFSVSVSFVMHNSRAKYPSAPIRVNYMQLYRLQPHKSAIKTTLKIISKHLIIPTFRRLFEKAVKKSKTFRGSWHNQSTEKIKTKRHKCAKKVKELKSFMDRTTLKVDAKWSELSCPTEWLISFHIARHLNKCCSN